MSINVRALQEVKDERINEKGRERENKWKRERERDQIQPSGTFPLGKM